MYKICFYVPEAQAEVVKNAMFSAGAGKIGDYSHCAWQVAGVGQFLPLEGSDAYIGQVGKLEYTPELKVEMVCAEECIRDVIAAMKTAHPYETPAYQVIRVEAF